MEGGSGATRRWLRASTTADAGGGDGVEGGDSVEKMLAEMPNRKDTNRFDPETHAVAHGRA